MILDLIDPGVTFIGMLLVGLVICFIILTIGRFIAYKKNKSNNKKNQFNFFLIITIILAVSMIYLFFYILEKKPYENQWQNISTYHEK